ncbi:ParB/Sulfiredoxin [uncultured Caudovirales phage]|uniref:ParB/Sulfiredoxin n=1 Tax=uncultured Caudovirales phage TaxID=2100421 RepID=A0A6J5NCL8_9CAUD|nr:ParB/Sulfiredoxin [uncultured Caudovirales phage]
MIKLKTIKPNPSNPRLIKDERFRKLVESVKKFPRGLELRPVIVNDDGIIIAGNQRYKALLELDYKEVPNEWIKKASDFTESELRDFIVTDNVSFGEHDTSMLLTQYSKDELDLLGIDVAMPETEADYSLLDDESLDADVNAMARGVRKAIQIEFQPEHYEEASALVKEFRDLGAYVGALLVEKLKDEKAKL